MHASPALPAAARGDDFLGHPRGLYVCFFTEMWERFSFYGMKALLLLFLLEHHRFGDETGYDIIGAYGGLVYAVPVIGGLLADRWLGMRKAVVFGGILLVLGHAGMAFEGAAAVTRDGVVLRDEAGLWAFYFSLALIIMGVGFLKPNISTIVGKLYPPDDARRDSAFSLFYAGINLGALFASVVCGYLGQALGWRYGFGAAGVGMLLGLVMFVWGRRYLQGQAEPPDAAALDARGMLGLRRETMIYLGAVGGLLPLAGLMWAVANHKASLGDNVSLAMAAMLVMMTAVLAWFAWFVLAKCERVERDRMLSLMALIFMCLVFFTLYEQTYGSWITFNDRLMTKDIAPALVRPEAVLHWGADWAGNVALFFAHAPWSTFSLLLAPLSFMLAATIDDRLPGSLAPRIVFGGVLALLMLMLVRDLLVLPQNASSLTYLGSLFLVLLAPLFSLLWSWLDRRGADPSKPVKSAIGLAFGGLAFVPLALAAQQAGAQGVMVSVWWLVLAYFILEVGEMCLSPIGLSAVTQLSVPKVVSLMMGTWFLATAFSEALAAQFGKLAAIEIEDGGALAPGSAEWIAAAAKYEHLFWLLTWIGLGCALVALVFAPLIRRGMHGVR